MESKGLKTVYTITERGERSFWHRIGVGYVNKDGSISIKLDAVPVNGTMHVRDYESREAASQAQGQQQQEGRKTQRASSRTSSPQLLDSMPAGF